MFNNQEFNNQELNDQQLDQFIEGQSDELNDEELENVDGGFFGWYDPYSAYPIYQPQPIDTDTFIRERIWGDPSGTEDFIRNVIWG